MSSDSGFLKDIVKGLKEGLFGKNTPSETPVTKSAEETGEEPVFSLTPEEIIERVDRELPPRPAVKLNPKRADNTGVFESKMGGVPYMPKDHEYPTDRSEGHEGEPLRLLAQLNFEKLPHIENFPEKGILQFFCACNYEGLYGIDFDDPISAKGFRVIYHENIITDESMLMSAEDIPRFEEDTGYFPFDGEFILEAGSPEKCPASANDYRFEEAVVRLYSETTGRAVRNIYGVDIDDRTWENIFELRSFEQTCIGGYPFFTQEDVRHGDKYSEYDILLFQSASTWGEKKDDIMWGDLGVGNFFISSEDLKKLDFSKVLYNWDCG